MNVGIVVGLFVLLFVVWLVGNIMLATKIDNETEQRRVEDAEHARGKSEAKLGIAMTSGDGPAWEAYRRGYVDGLMEVKQTV